MTFDLCFTRRTSNPQATEALVVLPFTSAETMPFSASKIKMSRADSNNTTILEPSSKSTKLGQNRHSCCNLAQCVINTIYRIGLEPHFPTSALINHGLTSTQTNY